MANVHFGLSVRQPTHLFKNGPAAARLV